MGFLIFFKITVTYDSIWVHMAIHMGLLAFVS